MKHRRTDPACILHRPPRNPWWRWWFDRNRGRSCRVCMTPAQYLAEFAQDYSREFDRIFFHDFACTHNPCTCGGKSQGRSTVDGEL